MPIPSPARRLIVYSLYDRRGVLEDAVVHTLAAMREHASHILVMVNGRLAGADEERLGELADDVVFRENWGFDVEAHREALAHLGDAIDGYDEVVMTNDTWLGPVRPLAPVFARMDSANVDFWGMTDHAETTPHPLTGSGSVAYHVQSYWLAVRRRLLLSPEWHSYWRDLPLVHTYIDAVVQHETRFTAHFSALGYAAGVAFPHVNYGSENPSLYEADRLVADGCPTLKRRPFFQWPPELDQRGSVGRWALAEIASDPKMTDLVYRDLVRDAEPRALYTDASMLEVLGPGTAAYDPARSLRIVVIAHIYYVDMADELLDHIGRLPSGFDLVITTSDVERKRMIEKVLSLRTASPGAVDVRVVDSNEGRDQSAFLVGAADVLAPGRYDLVVKVHSKRTPQDGFTVGRHFRHQQLNNLLASPQHAATVIALFQREPGLGIVFPPTIHIGYPTIGHGWWANRPGVEALCARLGIRVPLDAGTPLAPYGSMFVARPEALALLTQYPWTYEEFGGVDAYRDGGPAHVIERMPSYAAAELGYHSRTVVTSDYLSVSYTALEYAFDRIVGRFPGTIDQKLERIRRAGHLREFRLEDVLRIYMRVNHPHAGQRLRRYLSPVLRARRWWLSTLSTLSTLSKRSSRSIG